MSVVIDDAKVECDTGPINFKPTVMFQTRLFKFTIKNTGLGTVDYKWAVQKLDGTVDSTGPYTVSLHPEFDLVANHMPGHLACISHGNYRMLQAQFPCHVMTQLALALARQT